MKHFKIFGEKGKIQKKKEKHSFIKYKVRNRNI